MSNNNDNVELKELEGNTNIDRPFDLSIPFPAKVDRKD